MGADALNDIARTAARHRGSDLNYWPRAETLHEGLIKIASVEKLSWAAREAISGFDAKLLVAHLSAVKSSRHQLRSATIEQAGRFS